MEREAALRLDGMLYTARIELTRLIDYINENVHGPDRLKLLTAAKKSFDALDLLAVKISEFWPDLVRIEIDPPHHRWNNATARWALATCPRVLGGQDWNRVCRYRIQYAGKSWSEVRLPPGYDVGRYPANRGGHIPAGNPGASRLELPADNRALSRVRDELESELIKSGYLADAPFQWVGLIIRYGLVDETKPSLSANWQEAWRSAVGHPNRYAPAFRCDRGRNGAGL